jgi:hypothetical protein
MERSRTKEENRRYWQSHVEAYRKSGLSQREYCRQQGISYWSFNPWKRKLGPETKKVQEIPQDIVRSISPTAKEIELILVNGIRISIPDRFSGETLRNLLNILGTINR